MAEVIVLEKRPRWSSEIHRQLREDGVVVRACQDVTGLREQITNARSARKSSVAVLDPNGWAGECLPVIAWLRSLKIHVVVVGFAGIELLEPSLRELGTTTLLFPPVAGHEIADTCRRLLSQHSVQSRNKGSH